MALLNVLRKVKLNLCSYVLVLLESLRLSSLLFAGKGHAVFNMLE